MAEFNPRVQDTNAPSYIGMSQPISQPQPDRSMESLFKGIGNFLESGVKAVDSVIKNSITNQVHDQVDSLRDEYTDALIKTDIRANLANGLPGAAAVADAGSSDGVSEFSSQSRTSNTPLNILNTTPEENLPRDVQSVGDTTSTLKNAYDAGKISQTYYYGRLNSIAKNLRSKYPGYREYIDKQISGATGVNPANAYMTSIISDINRAQTASNSSANKTMQLLKENMELPGAAQMLNRVNNGQAGYEEVYSWASEYKNQEWNRKQRAASRTEYNDNQELLERVSGKDANDLASTFISNQFDSIRMGAGINTGQGIQKFVTSLANGTEILSSENANKLVNQLAANRNNVRSQLWAQFNEQDPDGRSLVRKLKGGAEEANKIIDANMVQYDKLIEYLTNKDYGAAALTLNISNAKKNDTRYNIQSRPGIGQIVTNMSALEGMAPEFAKAHYVELLKMGVNLPQQMAALVQETNINMLTQPDVRMGAVHTMKSASNRLKEVGARTPQTMASIIDTVNSVTDPKATPEIVINAARSIFDSSNLGFIDSLQMDTVDTSGKTVPGKYSVFNRFTSKPVVDAVVKTNDMDVRADMKNWVEQSFGRELFGRELNSLKNISLLPNSQLYWDSEKQEFGLKLGDNTQGHLVDLNKPATRIPQFERQYMQQTLKPAQQAINRINYGLRGLKNVAEAVGIDVQTYLLNTMMDAGADLSGVTATDALAKSVINSRVQQQQTPSNAPRNEDFYPSRR